MCEGCEVRLLCIILNNIRFIMEERDIRHDKFYNDTGIHIGRILSLKGNMTINTLEQIAKYLDVPIEDLIK